MVFMLISACGDDGGTPMPLPDGGAAVDAGMTSSCADGPTRCDGSRYERCVDGAYDLVETCAAACAPGLGCVTCVPGTGTCDGDTSTACREDGSGFETVFCDPVQGMSCSATTGICDGACAPAALGQSNIGCDYFPTVTPSALVFRADYHFGVVVANTSSAMAQVTIEGGALEAPVTFAVAPGAAHPEPLPWVDDLLNGHRGALTVGGAYRLRSTQPVTVYQYSPIEYDLGGELATANDASLLFPANSLTGNYAVLSWHRRGSLGYSGGFSVTATTDGTMVTVTTTGTTVATDGAPAFVAGVPQVVGLDRGDVLLVGNGDLDLSGSRVEADQPVQVVAFHRCAQVPVGDGTCDHMEESIPPIETLDADYIVTAPGLPSMADGVVQTVRVLAIEADTNLSYDPPVADAPAVIAEAGGLIEIPLTTTSFRVHADKKILVAQYMTREPDGTNGDPALTVSVATGQFRDEYIFYTPPDYLNYVNVVAPTGTSVMLDGEEVTGFAAIGDTAHGVARVLMGEGSEGQHRITASSGVGVQVYGWGWNAAYVYPAGMNLRPITLF